MIFPYRILFVASVAALGAGLALVEARPITGELARCVDVSRSGAERTVFIGRQLADEDRMALTAALAGSGHPGVVLFDAEETRSANERFLKQFQPEQMLSVEASDLPSFYQAFYPDARELVVSPARPRHLLLQAACLAGALRAPLFVSHGRAEDARRLQRCLAEGQIRRIHAVGEACACSEAHTEVAIHRLKSEDAVISAYLAALSKKSPVTTLVIANPSDADSAGGMSTLGPWLALQKRGLLLLTNAAGDNVETLVQAALRRPGVDQADSLILLGDLKAIPVRRRANPLPGGKDEFIEMEPLTPAGDSPHTFAVGRLFHKDPNIVPLMLARARLLQAATREGARALVASNPGGGLPLLESFSRNTARELANAGYDTTGLFEGQVKRDELRRLLPLQNIFLWEGHYMTLVRNYGVHAWDEPLSPSLVFLQSCLALSEDKALPFLSRGACAVLGTSTRTYSASGGAFALAYFDALLYEQQSLGGSLRHAKNFLQSFARFKEKRLGTQTKLGGANIRTSWAFTLWGDPTLKLPAPSHRPSPVQRVKHQVQGNIIRIAIPEVPHEKATVGRYETEIWANSRIGGLLRARDGGSRRVVPLVFTEVPLPQVPANKTPALSTRLPGKNWVFSWDARRRCGYVLAAPRVQDAELRFRVIWD